MHIPYEMPAREGVGMRNGTTNPVKAGGAGCAPWAKLSPRVPCAQATYHKKQMLCAKKCPDHWAEACPGPVWKDPSKTCKPGAPAAAGMPRGSFRGLQHVRGQGNVSGPSGDFLSCKNFRTPALFPAKYGGPGAADRRPVPTICRAAVAVPADPLYDPTYLCHVGAGRTRSRPRRRGDCEKGTLIWEASSGRR